MWTLTTLERLPPSLCRRAVGVALLLLALVAPYRPAAALDVVCIESSRYAYLYKLFGDDQRRFAAYFNLDAARLPPPAACRAALISGHVEPKTDDADKLIAFLAQNRGWLDTIYLDSGGGNVVGGVRLALVARDFWLKTRVAPSAQSFSYQPDFGPPAGAVPPDAGRAAFDKATAGVLTQRASRHPGRCASACTYALAAGIDRNGVAAVHRPANKDQSLEKRSRADRAEIIMMNLYKKMDVGEEFMALTRSTARQVTSKIVISRYPRFIEDALLDQCKSDGAQLDDLAALQRFALAAKGSGLAPIRDTELKDALARLETRRRQVTQCVAAVNEKERLAAFARMCPRGCDTRSLEESISQRLNGLRN